MTDIRTSIGTKYKNSPYGFLEDLTKTKLSYILPDDEGRIILENEENASVTGGAVYELFEKSDFDPLLTVKKGHSALVGKCASYIKQVGKGYVIMLGTLPEDDELLRIMKKAAKLSNSKIYDVDEGLMVTKRVHNGDVLYIVASFSGKEGEFRFDGEYEDIICGITYRNAIKLKPYQLHILRKVK
jgi:hypothetical protein